VIQEVFFAQRIAIICSDRMISGNTFGLASNYLLRTALWQKIRPYLMLFTPHEHRHAGGPGIEAPGSVIWALQHFDAPPYDEIKLHPKLLTTLGRGAKAKDLRDHVYALRGPAKEAILWSGTTDLELPDVNYHDSLNVGKAFIDWTKFMIEEEKNYFLFAMVEERSHRAIKSLPSWVPDMVRISWV
jgi:hypothetical protein